MKKDEGLRRDVADYIEGHYRDRAEALAVADSILAIPEIANALHFVEALRTPGAIQLVSGPPLLSPTA